jgi:hypothetical protein
MPALCLSRPPIEIWSYSSAVGAQRAGQEAGPTHRESSFEITQKGDGSMITKMMGLAIFAEDFDGTRVERCAAKLERAGYQVLRLPPELREHIEFAGDDFFEIFAEMDEDEADFEIEVRAIVSHYDGDLDCIGEVEPGHIPFDFFDPLPGRPPLPSKEWLRAKYLALYPAERRQ